MGDVSGNWCEPDINHLPSNDRGVRRREIIMDVVFCSKHCNPYSSEGHDYRRGNQPTVEVEDQHMAEPDSEDQVLNTSKQWVDTFCDLSQNSSYNPDIGGSSSYHPDICGSSPFNLEQPPTSVDMFGNNMYSTPPQATIDPVANPSDVYNTPQRPPRQRRPVNRYTPNDDTTPGSFQF
ncbi:hypothetical protein GOBAR_AA11900 [Gossypium barbadense]|uniref:Uncharacterized protein n=1 Tax=Gossypium barbadense TaxID=3634 RepID=A0A2P5XZK2_GOSBA|nr:hypothetical protein GOBAR_AA11900 [Gossypium barbadense]